MSNLVVVGVSDDGVMDSIGPRSGGPVRRWSFTLAEKLELLGQYEEKSVLREGGAFLRAQGLYSSQMTEWRRLRDGGLLDGSKATGPVGKLSAEQAEIARLRRQLGVSEAKLKTSEAALEIMGKLSAFFENATLEPGQQTPTQGGGKGKKH